MRNLLLRRFVACVSAVGVFGLALLPAEHVHVARTDDGRHTDVIHRHYEPHHPHHWVGSEARLGDHDDDDDAQWLSSAFIGPKLPSHLYPVAQLLAEDLAFLQPQRMCRGMLPSIRVSVHDPPWTTRYPLRAPPALLV